MTIRGSCLCGKAKYEIDGPLGQVDHCHCTFCRKSHGAAFGSYADVDPKKFRWLGGTDTVARYQSSSHSARLFCRNCGSSLAAEIAAGTMMAVTLGTIDGEPSMSRGFHMFVRSRASWYQINDDLPQYDEYPPNMTQFTPTG